MVNWQTFTIAYTIPTTTRAYIGLDGHVDFCDEKGKEKIICEGYPFGLLKENQRIQIDVEKLKNRYFESLIHKEDNIIRRVGSLHYLIDSLIPSSSDEIVSRSNNNLASINQNQAGTAIQMLNRAIDSDPRNKYTASMEVDPKTGNVFYHLSGERK